jgi:conjugative relaxase-like TrwC/TraI family protein
MLNLSKPLTAAQAQNYHRHEFTSKEQSYWGQGGEIVGTWQGRLASHYGLGERVGAEEFARLSQGQHPQTGEQLVRHRASYQYQRADGKKVTSTAHLAGWDATFSAPKSVSLTALVGGDERVRQAHRVSVRVALHELERYAQARIGGNHPAVTTGKLIVASFEHDTARPVNGYAAPQLHTHAVIFNLTELENGRVRALQARSLFRSQQFATAVYQAELTFRLARLGYEFAAGRSGAPEIRGYSEEYLDASSPRRKQIQEHLDKLGLSSKASAEIAAHATRDRKQILTPHEVIVAHQALAAEFGNQADRVVAEARARAQSIEQHTPATSSLRAQEAITYSREKNFEREAVVDERVLMRDALRRGMGRTTFSELRRQFEARVGKGEFVTVAAVSDPGRRLFTTPEMLAAERAVIQHMIRGQGQVEPVLWPHGALALSAKLSHLNAAQKAAVEHVLVSLDRVLGIQGSAGAGKTTALAVIREQAEVRGYSVEGLAPTSRASKQLEQAGIPAGTLQAFLARRREPGFAGEKHLYMVDESSLTSTNQMRTFLARLEPYDRVLLIGDIRQHQAVEAGKPFEQLQNAGMSTAKLEQIVRQSDPGLKAVVEQFAKGQARAAIQAFVEQGRITEIADRGERIRAIARAFARQPESTLVISPDNASRRELNTTIRAELEARGIVASENYQCKVLVQAKDMTGAERCWAARYNLDDVLRYSRGSKVLGIGAASYARVVAVDPDQNLLTVEKASGAQVTYDPKRLSGVSVYQERVQPFAAGDRVQFTAPDKNIGVANRELATIESVSPAGSLAVRLEKGRTVRLDPGENRHFDHGYAMTSHSAQGVTADRVLINADTEACPNLVNSRFAYVAISRARHDVVIFTNDSGTIAARLGNEISKSSALGSSPSLELGLNRGLGLDL